MPKINRIRIANIQYDKKVIKDLFLNCYYGENVLLNLANGGGKSVLVQLLQQPVLPESKVHNREMYHYLSPEQPSYILIEWKLDHTTKDYLLTGIVMSRLFSSDDRNTTKYFTFLHEYQSSNEFDIKNIPLIQKDQNVVTYKSYEAAMKLIKEKQNVVGLSMYGRGEQRDYREKLSEYGIFTNEWKILAKMNENEGGVDELFKDCKTSDSLVNKWILKTISDGNEAEGRELKEMFVSLMEEIIEQEKNIKEKEILEEFKIKIEEYEEPLKKLLEQLEEEKKVETNIHNIYVTLQKLSQENQAKIDQIAQNMLQNEKELEQINYEELSEEFYQRKSDLEAIQEEKETKQLQVSAQEQAYEKARFEYRKQKVAFLYQKEREAIAKLEALQLARNNLENKNNTDEQMVKIEYNLQEKYQQKIKEYSSNLEDIKIENEKIKEEVEKGKKKKEENQKEITKLSKQIGILEEKMGQFEKKEKALWEKMEIFLARNLLNELEEKEVQKIKDTLQFQIEQVKNEVEENKKQIEKITKQMEESNQKEEAANQQIEELTKQYTQKQLAYQEFQKQERSMKEILNFHRMKEQSIFEKEANMTILQEKQLEYKRKIEELVTQINRIKDYMLDLEQGGIHTSREVRKMLENANIEYITGEEYLNKQEEDYKKELLEKNPLLPYCYIVTQEDLEKIKTLEIKEEVSKISPILTYQNISQAFVKEKQMVQIENIYFLSLYHQDCFSIKTDQYKEKLKGQLEDLQARKSQYEVQLYVIEGHMYTVKAFPYQEKDKREMEQALVSLERQIQNQKEEIEKGKEQKKQWQLEKEKKQQENEIKREILQKKEKEQEEFLQYLEENILYGEDKKQKEICEQQKERMQQENNNWEKKREELEKRNQENLTIKNELTHQLERIKQKKAKIPERENQENLQESLEELEAKYEQLTKQYDQNRKLIEDQIAFWMERKVELEKEKQKDYGDINQEDYALMVYSEEIEDLTKERKEEEEKRLQERKEELAHLDKKLVRIDTQFQTICDNLRKMGKSEPIPAYQIKGNYDFRKKEIQQKGEQDKKREKELLEQNKKMQRQINDIERNIEVRNILKKEVEVEIQTVNLPELLKQYQVLKQENQKGKDTIFKKHIEISNQYREKHRIITAFLENVSVQNTEEGFYDFYYIYEKMVDCLEKLTEYIGILNLSLQNIEQDKKNILQHAVKQGIMLYQEMKKISDSSKIRIGDRYVQILKIEIPPELKENVEQRIENHLQYCIQSLREECKQSEDRKKTIENKVAILLSDRQLLNLTLDIETIKVKLYKFDIENKNSGLRQWEEVIAGNSGGQKFIACFALISALIEYTRRKELELKGEEEKVESSKIFVLDNPFGKTSSKHLLEPMIEISKKFNIQMICLSDLSQSSITDKFTLIYQLALRSSKYTNKSFLMVEDSRINGEVYIDTSLEQVYLRNYVEQLSFLT